MPGKGHSEDPTSWEKDKDGHDIPQYKNTPIEWDHWGSNIVFELVKTWLGYTSAWALLFFVQWGWPGLRTLKNV